MKEKKYKIGEISSLFGMTPRMLRHYEKIGLLVPSMVDEFTDYRYYSKDDLLKLFCISEFKKLGLTLSEIKSLYDENCHRPDIHLLEQKLEEYEKEMERLRKCCKLLRECINHERGNMGTEDTYMEKLPSITVVSHTMKLLDYDKLHEYVLRVIIPEMFRIGCNFPRPYYYFTREIKQDNEGIEMEYCEQVLEMKEDSDILKFKLLPEVPQALCRKVYGPWSQLSKRSEEFHAEIVKQGYRIVGETRFCYEISAWNENNEEKWLTIIQVPVEKV